MSEAVEFVSNKLPLFSEKKEWVVWSEVFYARAERSGYQGLLDGSGTEIPKSTKESYTDEEKKVMQLNSKAYGDLISCMDVKKDGGKVAFHLIKSTKTKDYEKGNASLAWKKLINKYEPKSAPSLTKIHKEFYAAKLKDKSDPDVWITHLEELRIQMEGMGSTMDDRQFLLHALNNLGRDYDTTVLMMEQKLGKSNADCSLTIEELREALCLKHERMGVGRADGGNKEEHALAAGSNGRRCHQCGKIGHIARNCRTKAGNNKSNFNNKKFNNKKNETKKPFSGDCHYCHKKGHMKKDCFKWKKDQKEGKSEVAEVVLTATEEDWMCVELAEPEVSEPSELEELSFCSSLEFPQFPDQEFCFLVIPEDNMAPQDEGQTP